MEKHSAKERQKKGLICFDKIIKINKKNKEMGPYIYIQASDIITYTF